jgi:NodT family efflux transporter outer membrane factor (OMF) lipoprotein
MQCRGDRCRSGALLARVLLAIAWIPGCTVGPDYVAPEPDLPDAWHEQLARGLVEGEANLHTWWTVFDDALLTSLIERASTESLDIKLAVARVDEARARRGIARGEWFPSLDGVGSLQRNRSSKEISETVPPPQSRTDTFYSSGFDATWEIDFFGRIRRSVESATAGLEASIEDYRDVLVSIFAEIGITYVEVRALQERIQSAESNVETQRGALQLTTDRNRAGLVGDLDVRQAEQNLASTESTIPVLRTSLVQAINRLGVLLGEPPSSLHAELGPVAPIPQPPDEVLVGLPAELLRQRPDIRAAEREFASQTAQIGVATADLYPRFTLLGTFALEATDFVDWFTGDAISYGFGPAFRWNIFDGGRIRSNIEAQDALTEQTLIRYEQTLLFGLQDVEDAMVAYIQQNDRRDALNRSVVAARKSVELVDTLYRTGLTDFQNVLDTQRTQFLQEDSLAQSEGIVSQNLIQVYRALGGGWSP